MCQPVDNFSVSDGWNMYPGITGRRHTVTETHHISSF